MSYGHRSGMSGYGNQRFSGSFRSTKASRRALQESSLMNPSRFENTGRPIVSKAKMEEMQRFGEEFERTRQQNIDELNSHIITGNESKASAPAKQAAVSANSSPLFYQATIGHYGGVYVYLPADRLDEFKAMLPKGMFPRNVEVKEVSKSWTPQGVAHWQSKYPNSDKVAIVYFANASKGEKYLEDNIKLPFTD